MTCNAIEHLFHQTISFNNFPSFNGNDCIEVILMLYINSFCIFFFSFSFTWSELSMEVVLVELLNVNKQSFISSNVEMRIERELLKYADNGCN